MTYCIIPIATMGRLTLLRKLMMQADKHNIPMIGSSIKARPGNTSQRIYRGRKSSRNLDKLRTDISSGDRYYVKIRKSDLVLLKIICPEYSFLFRSC